MVRTCSSVPNGPIRRKIDNISHGKRTEDGWNHLATVLDDECYYYEDKFSLVFPVERNARFERFGCAACCHVGGGRPYGYKGDDETIDVWHWKATRVDPVGQIDDKYWSEVVLGETNGRHDRSRHGSFTVRRGPRRRGVPIHAQGRTVGGAHSPKARHRQRIRR